MFKVTKKAYAAGLAMLVSLSGFAGLTNQAIAASTEAPVKFTITYSDNATLPFKKDWLGLIETSKAANADVTVEAIPNTDYLQKITLMLSSGTAPDVVMYNTIKTGEMAAMALNGVFFPISEHPELTPNHNATAEKFGLEEALESVKLLDGIRYYMPELYDKQFYDGGLIIREDFLVDNDLAAPTTYYEYYEVMKAYKEQFPESYPLTNLVDQRVTYRMTMPSFGFSIGQNAAAGSYLTISYDYDKKEFFPAAVEEMYRDYLRYFAQLYAEGLYDPEFENAGDSWTTKLATGAAMTSFAYYDQLGGIEAVSEIEGIKFNMLPPLEGPGGAHHQPKSRIGAGASFPMTTTKRADFEEIVKAVDEMFFSEELAKMWCLGVEGVTYTMDGDKVVFNDEILNSPDGPYKAMQLLYGLGTAPLQQVWVNEREMTKYDENYAEINKIVAAMDDAIQPTPPAAKFDDIKAELASLYTATLYEAFTIWTNDFITGKKDLDDDWDTYVAEMESKNIHRLVEIYNENL